MAVALAVGLVQGPARAQSGQSAAAQHEINRHYKAQPLNLHKEQLGTTAYAADARKRMAAGDFEGALTAFDAALRTDSEDPTLYRDRGLCHEKLGHPYPAIDDYREYLTDAPEAPDAEAFRGRLSRLEEDTNGSSPSAKANDDTDVPPATASATIDTEEAKMSTATATSRDKLQYDHEDDPLYSVLRRGKGFAIAPFFSEHKWFFDGTSFGASETWAECVGLQLRYEVGPVGGLLLEAGYEHFNATSLDQVTIIGFTSLLAFEFRLPLDADYDNQLFLAPGLGYEHVSFSPTDSSFGSIAGNALGPRLRFGYRHLLQDEASIDFSIDGGFTKWFVSDGGEGSSIGSTTAMMAINVAIVWGL